MSFDKETRNLLARTVGTCRRRLVEDVTDQLRGVFGLHPDGTVIPIEKLTYLSPDQTTEASRLRDLLDHYAASAAVPDADRRKAALERICLETAFTALNRLAALRLCEERGLVVECVRKSTASDGFQMFERISGGALGGRFDVYRVFLECLFDELALDLGVLFDRTTPQSAVFPTERCIEDVLAELNKPELEHLWTEDETIGWIYQYFNPPEERRAMRDASQAPRNSRELAVRNQFFTPRYVVEFLTDNTLGRMWYETRKGDTALKDDCRFLVRRPNEVFLQPDEQPPTVDNSESELSQAELLTKPVYVEHRAKKDPRDLRVLDPACGSGHFLLYAFDLLEQIYVEAWADSECPRSEGTGRSLREEFQSRDDLRSAVPKLIVEHNLHGIDIDPRAVQIAALALWLRAQRSWKNLRVKPVDRPQIAKSNIVTAEPMPGENDMRMEFVANLKPRVLGQLLNVVFEKMTLAGEAGSLLCIEEEIKEVVSEARTQWIDGSKLEQAELFPELAKPKPEQQQLRFDLTGVTDEEFWAQAEERILLALKAYAEQTEIGFETRRRLFAADAARGFAFIDLCRRRYDVVLMNPPFGDASLPSKHYVDETYGDTKGDVYKAFVESFHARLSARGYLGIISSRSGFFLRQSEDWRKRVLLRLFRPIAISDLGGGVLDAMVEVAAYVLRSLSESESRDLTLSQVPVLRRIVVDRQAKFSIPNWQAARGGLKRHQARAELRSLEQAGFIQPSPGSTVRYGAIWRAMEAAKEPEEPVFPPLVCFQVLAEANKGTALLEAVRNPRDHRVFVSDPKSFLSLPGVAFAYWASPAVRALLRKCKNLGDDHTVASGTGTLDDFRFLRLWSEVPAAVSSPTWFPYAKGGAFSRYYFDQHLSVNWANDGAEMKAWIVVRYGGGHWARNIRSTDLYFWPGLTWPRRSQRGLSVRALPMGCVFGDKGPALFCQEDSALQLLVLLALTNSSPFRMLVSLQMAFGSYEVGVLQSTAIPHIDADSAEELSCLATDAWLEKYILSTSESTSHAFLRSALLASHDDNLAALTANSAACLLRSQARLAEIQAKIDKKALRLYGLVEADISPTAAEVGAATELDVDAETEPVLDGDTEQTSTDAFILVSDFLDQVFGCAVGRWDVRVVSAPWLSPKRPSPFDALPHCSPGMLVDPVGLPASANRIVSEEWLRARQDPTTLPPEGSVKSPVIPDSAYPIRVNWDGIVVDDPGFHGGTMHRDDIIRRMREVLDVLWRERAHEIEQEACEILGVTELRDYFRKAAGFLQDHLKRYSRSRRKAPIYWPLSTPSGLYTIWIYYHRLTDQTLYEAVNQYVEPKSNEVERGIARTEEELKSASGRELARLNDQLSDARTFLGELRGFREELLRIAALPYRPNLNDGVIINAAPFHRLFRLRSWAKETEECWKSLAKGDYDWAHLAYTIWPDRVREVCKRDRSIAIAHGLEELCETQAPRAKKKEGGRGKRKVSVAEEKS